MGSPASSSLAEKASFTLLCFGFCKGYHLGGLVLFCFVLFCIMLKNIKLKSH